MPDISKPLELGFVFGSIGFIFVVIGIGVYLVKRFTPKD